MSDGYGNTSRNVFAFFDPDTSSWKTSTPSLFPGETDDGGDRHRSKRSLVTWPRSGMTRAGEACELRTWAPATDESASSSLLPTPCAKEPGGTVEQYHERLRKFRPGTPTFTPLTMLVQLLPTPAARDWKDSIGFVAHPEKSHLTHTIKDLLPTPNASDDRRGRGSMTAPRNGSFKPGLTLTDWAEQQSGDRTPPLSLDGSRPVVDVPLPPWTDGDSSPPSSSNG
jgi:hypothetical protein